ncbi:MAG: hypothetical protein J5833_00980 [Victivallales bacterium]|nr:hypothetical protein [Victivallales bacterium]
MDEENHIPAADYMPHRPPMAMVDFITRTDDGDDAVLATIRPDNRFLNSDGVLDNSAVPELVAQAAAATNSFKNGGKCRPGMLTLARDIRFFEPIHVNDELLISAKDENPLPDWFVLYFKIECRNTGRIFASGEVSVCLF